MTHSRTTHRAIVPAPAPLPVIVPTTIPVRPGGGPWG